MLLVRVLQAFHSYTYIIHQVHTTFLYAISRSLCRRSPAMPGIVFATPAQMQVTPNQRNARLLICNDNTYRSLHQRVPRVGIESIKAKNTLRLAREKS